MTKAANKPVEQAESADLMVMASVNPLAVFTDREQFSQFYTKMKAETDKHVADVSTEKGRSERKALAFKVTKAKTTLERAGKELVEEWRQKTAVVTSARVQMVAELDALAKEVRRPVTEWEAAEEARITHCTAIIDGLKAMARIDIDDTAAMVRERGKIAWEVDIGEEFGDMADEAKSVKASTVATLQSALVRLTKEEADRAELEVLRAANAEREARETADREAAEQAERERHAAEAEAQRVAAAEEADAQRIRDAEERAAQGARDEAARVAREAEEQRQREHGAALATERAQREEAERINREAEAREQERLAADKIAADEIRRREADRANRTRVQTAVKVAIMSCGADEDVARKIVLAIIAGEIPRVTLAF